MFDLDKCMANKVFNGVKTLTFAMDRRFSQNHTSRVQWIAMYYIAKHENDHCNAITQKELADEMHLKEPTVVRLIDRMEKDDLIKRCCCEKDRRIKHLCLSEKGKDCLEKMTEVACHFSEDIMKNISDEEAEQFLKVLGKMVENVGDVDLSLYDDGE